ncbi:MAG: VWA domain-containing protein [Flavobacteriaceae bacterium]
MNPSIEKKSLVNIKPKLSFLLDNSLSTNYFKQDSVVTGLLNDWKENTELNNRFDINYYSFGNQFQLNDSLSFDESQTNISEAIKTINTIHKKENNATVLVSDGNQTIGNDYEFTLQNNPVYPIVIGDTTKYEDLSIVQLNSNRYSFINNQFPVESLLLYEGESTVNVRYTIESGGRIIFRKQIRFNSDKTTETIRTTIKAEKEGPNFYRAKIEYLDGEKNISNNTRNFSVEVINKQSQILIVSSMYHPDLGALKKAVESDRQRKATIKLISDNDIQLNDFQLIVLYQPNNQFKNLFQQIASKKSNYFVVSGAQTDWNFLNNQGIGVKKKSIPQTENYGANYNAGFLTFAQKDIGFENFPPLVDRFGEVSISATHQILLYQSINGYSSQQPLLATTNSNNHKGVFLFGEGLWKWRANSYLSQNSFQNFDEFIGNLIQYASSKKIRERLSVDVKSLYNANEVLKIGAFYVDENYQFDPRATLIFTIKNKKTDATSSFPFSLNDNSYQLTLESLVSGDYTYTVTVEGSQNIKKSGIFKVSDYEVEQQFTSANNEKLQRLAEKTNGKLFYPKESDGLVQELLSDKRFSIKQKQIIKQQEIIDWKWILAFILGLLTIEWFTRKYYGKI